MCFNSKPQEWLLNGRGPIRKYSKIMHEGKNYFNSINV